MQNSIMKLDINGLHLFKQRKSHKKKRINKKWAKRYGYKNVFTLSDKGFVTCDNIDYQNMNSIDMYSSEVIDLKKLLVNKNNELIKVGDYYCTTSRIR